MRQQFIPLLKKVFCDKYFLRILTRMSTSSSRTPPLAAVCQLSCGADKDANLAACLSAIRKSHRLGAVVTFFPECYDFVSNGKQEAWLLSEGLDGPFVAGIRAAAKETGVWVSLGGMHRRIDDDDPRSGNSHVVVNGEGNIVAVYDKIHLFDVDIENGPKLKESDTIREGSELKSPLSTPIGRVGLQICYDLRFPESSHALTAAGAEILTFPSNFTVPTGKAHWEPLLRARAIENQAYVIAAAQVGRLNEKRVAYGHAMIVDPWGRVLVECGADDDVKVAPIDLESLRRIRSEMPLSAHRRKDIYGEIFATMNDPASSASRFSDTFVFGDHVILSPEVVFHSTRLSFAFVNRKPVLPGHVLIAPKRRVARVSELLPEEVADLFLLTQRVAKVAESHFGATSATVSVQDGTDAGQSVAHVHVHVLPRRKGDFERNDDIYEALEYHDKAEEPESWRSAGEMATEALELRKYFP